MKPTCISYQTQTGQHFEAQEEWQGKWDNDPITYSVKRGTEDLAGDSFERLAINLAMTTWDVEIKPKLQWVPFDQNPDITLEFKDEVDDPYFAAHKSVLAYAYFPEQGNVSGTVVFNDAYLWTMHGEPITADEYTAITGKRVENPLNKFRTYNIMHTLIHELGHSLGLRHAEDSPISVMHPYYNGTLDLSPLDIYRIRSKYGVRIYKHWIRYARIKKWLARRKLRF